MTDFSPEAMRKRFHELGRKAAAIRASSPRIERDAKVDELTEAQRRAYAEKIKAHEAELYDIDMERGALARALGGKTGEPG